METTFRGRPRRRIVPCGLGARDTLRFEAKLPLYGQELSADITPIEAGIGFAVKTDKESTLSEKLSLLSKKQMELTRKLVGIEMIEKGIPRHGYKVYSGEQVNWRSDNRNTVADLEEKCRSRTS